MRSRLISVLSVLLFALPAFVPIQARQPSQAAQTKSETVYITRTGKKFHKDGCQYLRQSKIPIKRSDAVAKYGACSVCRP